MKPKDTAAVKAAAEKHSNGKGPNPAPKPAPNPELRPWPEKMQGRVDRAYGRLASAEQQVTAMQQQVTAAQNSVQQERGRFREALEYALEEAGLDLNTNVAFIEGRIQLTAPPPMPAIPPIAPITADSKAPVDAEATPKDSA